MPKVYELEGFMDELAPKHLKEEWDNVGLLVGFGETQIMGVLISLDITDEVIDEAKDKGVNIIVSHHPLIFRGLKAVNDKTILGSIVYKLISSNIAALCYHTNLDAADGGVNDVLAQSLELKGVKGFHMAQTAKDNYYLGRIGELSEEYSAKGLALYVKNKLGCEKVSFCDGGNSIKTVAVISGSGGDYIDDAINAGADAMITGDLKYHQCLDYKNMGFTLIDAGHFNTENIIVPVLAEKIKAKFSDIPVYTSQRHKNCIETV